MAATLNISIEDKQKNWLNMRRDRDGFSSYSDVVRSLIREAQSKELAALAHEFSAMDKADGSNEPEPVEKILAIIKNVKTRKNAGGH